jgi:hypothetical protein
MTPGEPYVSARPRALVVQLMVGSQLVMLLGVALCCTLAAFGVESAASIAGLAASRRNPTELLFWATLVPSMMWVHRSVRNLPALGAMSPRFSPSEAVWSFFIPFVNFVRPYQVMAMIWRESQPALVREDGVPERRKASIVKWWWGVYWGQIAAVIVISRLTRGGGLELLGLRYALLYAVQIAVGSMFLVMITATQRRQDAMWDDLERQRSVPQPTAQYLR